MTAPLAARNGSLLQDRLLVSAILIGGCCLRLIGINVGLPDAPDPRESLIAADVLNLVNFTSPPTIYNWPGTAWFYAIAALCKVLSLFGMPLSEARIIFVARCLNVLLSTVTLWLTYRIGVRCCGKRVGQIAAGLLAVAMLHATNESRLALVDIPATFCVTLFLWRVVQARASSTLLTLSVSISLGIIAGIGFAVKFTTAFVGLSLLVFLRSDGFLKRVATVIGVSALTFTLLCPYWLIDLVSPTWDLFFEDFWYEATHYHRGHFGLISTAESDGIYRFLHLWTLLRWGLGVPLALLVVAGGCCALVSRKKDVDGFPVLAVLLLAFAVPYLLFLGVHKVKFARHLLILYPAFMLLAALLLTRLPALIARFLKSSALLKAGSPIHILSGVLGGIVVVYSLVYTCAFASILLTQPTKLAVSDWIAAHIPAEEDIAVASEPLFGWLLPEEDFVMADEAATWVLILVPELEVFQKYRGVPYQAEDWYPLEEMAVAERVEFYDRVLGAGSQYVLHKTFRVPPKLWGIRISDEGAPFPMRALTHPEFRVYRRFE